ncbi:uncharacterized protein LOC116854079 isoform X1 [Odontomachus brunneus]|uniref:uncharacterized protein LOC116854079 isoform X1 n=1 Tax=Odontomachus brunneus TaxID=486640 RepID=UPI0013F29FF1|nr:uncharacterized protein LOC116854079 isoform X1 [Odontomachus brunneus]
MLEIIALCSCACLACLWCVLAFEVCFTSEREINTATVGRCSTSFAGGGVRSAGAFVANAPQDRPELYKSVARVFTRICSHLGTNCRCSPSRLGPILWQLFNASNSRIKIIFSPQRHFATVQACV